MRSSLFSWLFLMSIYSLFFSFSIFVVSGQCLGNQQTLLLQLKNNLTFVSNSSTKLVTWNQNVDCCSWGGVTCRDGYVIGLDLSNESIGTIFDNRSSLISLSNLQSLNLANNYLGWSDMPSEMGMLNNLRYLNLSDNVFSGQIPLAISYLTRLVILDLSSSMFTQRLENPNLNMLIQNLSELTELYLDGIDILAQDNNWGQALSSSLLNLKVLSLSSCGLSGPIDSSLRNLRFLSVIDLSDNSFFTSVPEFFADFENLTSLNLSSNNFNGKFPKRIFQVSALQELDLSNNRLLQGSLPDFHPNESLRVMKLQYTNFSGTLSKSIGNLKMLSIINLQECNFVGSIPRSIARLTKLVYLDMSRNILNGSIPIFSKAKNLIEIQLSDNHLFGQITSTQWENLLNLKVLNLSLNSFDGNISVSLFSLPSLLKLDLSNNRFSGQIHEFTNGPSSLKILNLSRNNLEGPIPISIFELQGLKWLSLSSNNFSGSLQNHLSSKINESSNDFVLEKLDLSSNNLEGQIPISIFELQGLKWLSLSSNNFSGSLHNQLSNKINEFSNYSLLEKLDLSSNNLEGPIPIFIFAFQYLNWLSLSSNNFSGSLHFGVTQLNSLSFPNQPFLNYLDLSANRFKGKTPNWIQDLTALEHLNLSHNSLETLIGPFTSENLKIIDLHSNQLKGQLPDFPYVQYLDLSCNNFNSTILANISSALFVSFSSNILHGSIPKSICNAKSLQVLDLSNNSLSGTIPQCLIELSSTLVVVNLGSNKLCGTISDMFPDDCELQTLALNENKLEGELPKSLANCSMMKVLDVGNNNIKGTFPSHLKNISMMKVLILRSNKFHGQIPHLGNDAKWSMLQILDLASNNFMGSFPKINFSSMRAMIDEDKAKSHLDYLQYNHSSEPIYASNPTYDCGGPYSRRDTFYNDCPCGAPHGFSYSKGDTFYNDCPYPRPNGQQIYSRYFDEQSIQIGQSPSFHYQDVVTLTFKGYPMKLQKILTIFTTLDFSCNKFDGPIPEEIGELKLLYALNLSHNGFRGPIPSSLGKLTNLESLDLSSNYLMGKIPMQLADGLIFLQVLNLSFNQLQGQIPKIKQFATFENTSFDGNKALCGFPLSSKCTNEEPPPQERTHLNSKTTIEWNYISVELGFIFGMGIVILPLVFWKKWRLRYYQYVDNALSRIFPQLYQRGNCHRRRAHNNQRLRH